MKEAIAVSCWTVKNSSDFAKQIESSTMVFKLLMITTSKGHPVKFIITPASVADVTALKIMEISLSFGSTVYGDKAYTSCLFEDERLELEGIKLTPERKTNLSRQHSGCARQLQNVLQKRTETIFSLIVKLFPRKTHAVTKAGFLLKLVAFVASFSLSRFL